MKSELNLPRLRNVYQHSNKKVKNSLDPIRSKQQPSDFTSETGAVSDKSHYSIPIPQALLRFASTQILQSVLCCAETKE